MSIATIVILVGVILFCSVVLSVILTKREQAAALRRQQVASFRLKADEAQDLYDGLQIAGLEKPTYKFLLERVAFNLQKAYELAPKTPGIKTRLNSANNTLNSLDTLSFSVQMPGNMMELHGLIGRLNKLMKYLMLLFHNKSISPDLYQQLIPSIQQSSVKFDVEGHVKMGHQAANIGQAGTAKQSYVHAKEKLLELGVEDAYAQAQLQKIDELLENLEQEFDETRQSADQPDEQQIQQGSEVPTTENSTLSNGAKEESEIQEAVVTQEELNKMSDSDSGFSDKKKW
ncbi:MAG: hypothetical protein GY781_12400 [Gammaproteobacteria bacterium]|nr:hypothetical protein [Gammaproteobacteria bacterium]